MVLCEGSLGAGDQESGAWIASMSMNDARALSIDTTAISASSASAGIALLSQ